MAAIRTRRVYEDPAPGDGTRVLVDRVWPRGVSRERAAVSFWLKEVAPSTALRRWFGHDRARWEGSRQRYFEELDAMPGVVARLRDEAWRYVAAVAMMGIVLQSLRTFRREM